jgi:hypothetical protein
LILMTFTCLGDMPVKRSERDGSSHYEQKRPTKHPKKQDHHALT